MLAQTLGVQLLKDVSWCSVYFKRKSGKASNNYYEGVVYPLGTADVIKNITEYKNH